MATFTPAPRPLSTDELNEVRCALRSGQELTLAEALRLLATVDALQVALTWKRSREIDEESDLDLSEGYEVAPGQVHAVVVSMSADEEGALAWKER